MALLRDEAAADVGKTSNEAEAFHPLPTAVLTDENTLVEVRKSRGTFVPVRLSDLEGNSNDHIHVFIIIYYLFKIK
jgi:hypothetical protein